MARPIPCPLYKDGEVTYAYNDRQIETKQSEGWSLIPPDAYWPAMAYDAKGVQVKVNSAEEAEARGLSFERPDVPVPVAVPQSPTSAKDSASLEMVIELEKRVAAIEGLPSIEKALAKASASE